MPGVIRSGTNCNKEHIHKFHFNFLFLFVFLIIRRTVFVKYSGEKLAGGCNHRIKNRPLWTVFYARPVEFMSCSESCT